MPRLLLTDSAYTREALDELRRTAPLDVRILRGQPPLFRVSA
jgi:hypothetical protein